MKKAAFYYSKGVPIAFLCYCLFVGFAIFFLRPSAQLKKYFLLFPAFLSNLEFIVTFELPKLLSFISGTAAWCAFLLPCFNALVYPKKRWSAIVIIAAFSVDAVCLIIYYILRPADTFPTYNKLLVAGIELVLVSSQVIRLVLIHQKKSEKTHRSITDN